MTPFYDTYFTFCQQSFPSSSASTVWDDPAQFHPSRMTGTNHSRGRVRSPELRGATGEDSAVEDEHDEERDHYRRMARRRWPQPTLGRCRHQAYLPSRYRSAGRRGPHTSAESRLGDTTGLPHIAVLRVAHVALDTFQIAQLQSLDCFADCYYAFTLDQFLYQTRSCARGHRIYRYLFMVQGRKNDWGPECIVGYIVRLMHRGG